VIILSEKNKNSALSGSLTPELEGAAQSISHSERSSPAANTQNQGKGGTADE